MTSSIDHSCMQIGLLYDVNCTCMCVYFHAVSSYAQASVRCVCMNMCVWVCTCATCIYMYFYSWCLDSLDILMFGDFCAWYMCLKWLGFGLQDD